MKLSRNFASFVLSEDFKPIRSSSLDESRIIDIALSLLNYGILAGKVVYPSHSSLYMLVLVLNHVFCLLLTTFC